MTLDLPTLGLELQTTVTGHSASLLWIFFQPFKNIKTILSSQALQKQAAGQIWPNPVLRHPPVFLSSKR